MANNNQYTIRIQHCPEDGWLDYPMYPQGSTFVGVDFMESLYGGVFPKYMIVMIIGTPHAAPGANGTSWTVGPHPFLAGKQALYEYEGERVLASKPGKPSTMIDITEEANDVL